MKLFEVTDGITLFLSNEEKHLLKKLKDGVSKDKLNEREKEVILRRLQQKGLVQ